MQLSVFLTSFVFTLASSATAVESSPSNDTSLLWGPYRPNLYLGIRPRIPDGLLIGLMWGKLDGGQEKLRYTVEQNHGMAMYGWTTYDARKGGTQLVQDVWNHIDITTEFVKKHDGESAGNWALRIKGTPRRDAPIDTKTSIVFYVGMQATEGCTDCKLAAFEQTGAGDDKSVQAVNIAVKHPYLGAAGIHIPAAVGQDGQYANTVVKTLNVTEDKLWQAKSTFLASLKSQSKDNVKAGLADGVLHNEPGIGNMQFVQMTCNGAFKFDVLYSSHAAARAMTSAQLNSDNQDNILSFRDRFVSVFDMKPPFNTGQHIGFAQKLFADLLGGIGYFQGTAKVDTSNKAVYSETTAKFWEKIEKVKQHVKPEVKGPYELFTHTPSRVIHPRGFLQDEGFHLLPVLEWDADLAMEVICSWLNLMDDDGWLSREQALGVETESKTSSDAITQLPHMASPPTIFLVIFKFIDLLQGKATYSGHHSMYLSRVETGTDFVAKIYPLLKKHYEWFRRSQSGDVETYSIPSANLNEGYRWRGRTPETNYASGLGDYPRAEPPDISELHLDALCWVGTMSRTLEKIASFMENTHDISVYQNHIHGVETNLESIHWDRLQNMYCDTVVRENKHTHVCHKGYVSLFPLMTGVIGPKSPHLPAMLDILHDPAHLWTNHGVRSLSQESKKYGVGDNNWRSPIWINMNYLLIEQLLVLAQTAGPAQQRCRDIYVELRRNIVQTVYNSWLQTGFVWEQYDPSGGHGQGTQHFTGWTSLVVKIMAMPDLEPGEGVREKIKDMYEQAKQQAKQQAARSQGHGAGIAMFAVLATVFVYVTRRRFAGTWRSLRREKAVVGGRHV